MQVMLILAVNLLHPEMPRKLAKHRSGGFFQRRWARGSGALNMAALPNGIGPDGKPVAEEEAVLLCASCGLSQQVHLLLLPLLVDVMLQILGSPSMDSRQQLCRSFQALSLSRGCVTASLHHSSSAACRRPPRGRPASVVCASPPSHSRGCSVGLLL